MNGKGTNTLIAITLINSDCMQHIARLGSPIGQERFIVATFKVHIVKINITHLVPCRTQDNDAGRRRLYESRQQISSQQKVSKVINSELLLKSINRVSERRRHNSGIQNETMKWNIARHEFSCSRANRCK